MSTPRSVQSVKSVKFHCSPFLACVCVRLCTNYSMISVIRGRRECNGFSLTSPTTLIWEGLRYGALRCVSLISGMLGMYARPALTSARKHASEPRHIVHRVAARLHTLLVKAHPAQTRRVGERYAATAVSTPRFCGAGSRKHSPAHGTDCTPLHGSRDRTGPTYPAPACNHGCGRRCGTIAGKVTAQSRHSGKKPLAAQWLLGAQRINNPQLTARADHD
jgi:hypothetical protein